MLANGKTIVEYEDGSRLLLGRTGAGPVHVVVADEEEAGATNCDHRVRARPRALAPQLPPEAAAMRCVICRNGETLPGLADKAVSHDGMTLVVKDVPAEICDNCGERYVDAEVTRHLLELAREAAAVGVVVDVRHYAPA